MRNVQVLSVVAIGLGVGLLVAGNTASPLAEVERNGEVVWSVRLSSYQMEFYHDLAIALNGFGAGLLTLGLLGLFVPWINAFLERRCRPAPLESPPVVPS